MNLTEATKVVIDGKTVESISIDGRLVYEQLTMTINADKEYIKPESTVNIQFNCEKLPNKQIELFNVINMTRTSMGTETTDSNGKATWTYTGSGAGTVGFVAVYNEIESNTITVDDYTPVTSSISLTGGGEFIQGATVSLVASCTDQHSQAMGSGVTVTYYENGASIGTASTVSGVATLNISSLSVGTHMITANVGNVSSNAVSVVVSEAPTPVASSIDLVGTKSILSYADGESSVLTATVLDSNDDPVEGVLVNIYKGSDLWYSALSDSNGEVSKTYSSAGSGDIVFTAEVDSTLVSEIYEVEDCQLYRATLQNQTALNDLNISENFKATFKVKQLSTSSSFGGISIGKDTNNRILFGKTGSNSQIGIFIYNNGSSVANVNQNSVYQNNVVTDTEYTYNNGVQTITANNVTKTLTNSSITDRNHFDCGLANTEITDLKIKPL